jgi:hypothetical protein
VVPPGGSLPDINETLRINDSDSPTFPFTVARALCVQARRPSELAHTEALAMSRLEEERRSGSSSGWHGGVRRAFPSTMWFHFD